MVEPAQSPSQDIKRKAGTILLQWVPLVLTLGGLVGGGYVAYYRLAQAETAISHHETRIMELQTELYGKASAKQLSELDEKLNTVRTDVAYIRAKIEDRR